MRLTTLLMFGAGYMLGSSDSRSTARAAERARANLIAVPDGGRQITEGLVVEASVFARLFRIRLLAIDASLVVSPAHVKRRSPDVTPHPGSRAIGAGLVAAERFIDEGAASLAASAAAGTTAPPSRSGSSARAASRPASSTSS